MFKTLIENAPEQVDFRKTVEREYQIANLYYEGYREHPYTWMPWIENDNHATEIYEAVEKQSPYAKFIPDLLIRLGSLYLEEGKNTEAEKTYKKIIEEHADSKVAKTAYLDLAHLYLELAQRGDGDGYNSTKAKDILQEFMKKYPDTPEISWAKESLKQTYELGAERLYDLANYYYKRDNMKVAQRYIRDILINYPETNTTARAEKMLKSMDMPQFVTSEQPQQEKEKEKSKYKMGLLPKGITKETLVIPANSEDKWLLPINKESIQQEELLKAEYENKI